MGTTVKRQRKKDAQAKKAVRKAEAAATKAKKRATTAKGRSDMGPAPSTEACMTHGRQKTLDAAIIPDGADSDGITITPPPEKEISLYTTYRYIADEFGLERAREMFSQKYPDEVFLLDGPDPDELALDQLESILEPAHNYNDNNSQVEDHANDIDDLYMEPTDVDTEGEVDDADITAIGGVNSDSDSDSIGSDEEPEEGMTCAFTLKVRNIYNCTPEIKYTVMQGKLSEEFSLSPHGSWMQFTRKVADLLRIHHSLAQNMDIGYRLSTQRKTDVLIRLHEESFPTLIQKVTSEIQSSRKKPGRTKDVRVYIHCVEEKEGKTEKKTGRKRKVFIPSMSGY
jgi:hypothetical protein